MCFHVKTLNTLFENGKCYVIDQLLSPEEVFNYHNKLQNNNLTVTIYFVIVSNLSDIISKQQNRYLIYCRGSLRLSWKH